MSKLSVAIKGDVNAGNDGDFSPIPDGWYAVKIAGAEIKQTKAGTGNYVSVQFTVTGPTHANRRIFNIYNIQNPNAAAEKIGLAELGRLAGACGIEKLDDTDQLVGMHCEVKVATQKSIEYGDKNVVKGAREGAVKNVPMAAASIPSFDDEVPF